MELKNKYTLESIKEKLVVCNYCPNEFNLRPKKYARKKALPCGYIYEGKILVSPKTYTQITNNDPTLKEMYFYVISEEKTERDSIWTLKEPFFK